MVWGWRQETSPECHQDHVGSTRGSRLATTHWPLPSIHCIGFQSPKQHCPPTAIGQVPASELVHPSGTSWWDLSTWPNAQQQQTCQEWLVRREGRKRREGGKEGMQKRRGKTRPKQTKNKNKRTRNKEAGKGGTPLRTLYSTHLEQIVPGLLDAWSRWDCGKPQGGAMGLGYGSVGKVQL